MKIKNILALAVALIGFVACTSENELPNTPVSGELVPVTINLGSTQTKSVALEGDEGVIKNAVIAIFDSKGIPTVAPIVLNGASSSGAVRLPMVQSNAYAFVNVSDEDIEALKLISNKDNFKNYSIRKALTQNAAELPKSGKLENFTPTDNGTITIPVKQLTARVEALVDIKVFKDGVEILNEGLSFSKSSLSWSEMNFQTVENNRTPGNDPENGYFSTIINGTTYNNVLNRAYSYAGAYPTIELVGNVTGTMEGFNGMSSSLSYTFKSPLQADNVYLVRFIAKVDITLTANPTITYEVIPMDNINVDVPSFD